MALLLKRKRDGLTILWEAFSISLGRDVSDAMAEETLPEFMRRDYEIVRKSEPETLATSKVLTPPCGWDKLTLDNFEEEMGYRFRIDSDHASRGISRETAFLELLESKGVKRETRLISGLTLDNFKDKTGQRFRMTKEDKLRSLSRERSFEEWKKRNGYK